jgi:hypothetical protein
VLRADFGIAQIHGHFQFDRAALPYDTSLTDTDGGKVTGFVPGKQHSRSAGQYQ